MRRITINPAMLTAEELRSVLSYDPETGAFTWRVNRGGTALAGTQAGSPDHLKDKTIFLKT